MAEICRICLRNDEPLEDVASEESSNADVLKKLELCVPEVDWSESNELNLCSKCLQQAYASYQFKVLCCRSTDMFKAYMKTINTASTSRKRTIAKKIESKSDNDAITNIGVPPLVLSSQILNQINTNSVLKAPSFVSVLPEQNNLLASAPRLIIPNTSNNGLQNVFLNIVPMPVGKPPQQVPNTANNNTFYMICQNQNVNNKNIVMPQLAQISPVSVQPSGKFPIPNILRKPVEKVKKKEVNVNQLLTESQTEELSVEIDPLDFDLYDNDEEDEEEHSPGEDNADTEFANSGHFLFPDNSEAKGYQCEICSVNYLTISKLYTHIYKCHNGQFPFKCDYCGLDFALRYHYFNHLAKQHQKKKDLDRPITLADLEKNTSLEVTVEDNNQDEFRVYECNICHLNFNSAQTLKKHKVCNHGSIPQKRYFVKGTKNAFCKVCERNFSTVSYLFIHMNQHIRRGECTEEDLEEHRKAMNITRGRPPKHSLRNEIDDYDSQDNSQSQHSEESVMSIDPTNLLETKLEEYCTENATEVLSNSDNIQRDNSTSNTNTSNEEIAITKLETKNEEIPKETAEIAPSDVSVQSNKAEQVDTDKDTDNSAKKSHQKTDTESENADVVETPSPPTRKSKRKQQKVDIPEETTPKKARFSKKQKEKSPEELAPTRRSKRKRFVKTDEVQASAPEVENGSPLASLKIKINLRDIKDEENNAENQENSATSDDNNDCDDNVNSVRGCDRSSDVKEDGELTRNNHDTLEPDGGFYGIPIEGEPELFGISMEDNLQETQAPINLMDIEIVDGKPQCSFCKKLFGRRHDLKRHINNVHLKFIVYNCHVCNRKFYEGFHLTRHLRGHFSFITCATCLKPFCAIGELKNHHQVVHNGYGEFNCGVCNESFYNLDVLREHMEFHDKSIVYQCHLCNDAFSECRELTKHLVEHSGMYTCLVCQRPFCSEQDLSLHVKQHHSEPTLPKRYACDLCHNTYKKKRYLVIHQSNAHGIANKKTPQPKSLEAEDSS